MARPFMSYTTQQHQDSMLIDVPTGEGERFFRGSVQPPPKALVGVFPPEPSNNSLFEEGAWLRLRDTALEPLNCSELTTTEQHRAEFLEGMRLLRLDGERALPGRRPLPQQLLISDMLATGHKRNAILVPRRSTKSTSAIAVGMGRAAYREDYRVGILTLTSGKAGRSRFLKDVAPHIERLYPIKGDRPFRLVRIAGMEGVEFREGGSIHWLSTLDDVRGEAFDLLLLDEAGELGDPAAVSEVIAAALPTLDTRPNAQLVALGTAGRYRKGNLLWDALELGRSSIGGIVEYAVPPGTTDEELEQWEPDDDHPFARVRELTENTHPGVGTATTLDSVHDNFDSLGIDKYAREYLGIFGTVGETAGIINGVKWAEAGTGAELPAPPEKFSLAYAPHPDQIAGSIVIAWRDKKGHAYLQMLEHKTGVNWLAPTVAKITRKFRTPAVYDSGSQVALLTAEQLRRARPAPRMDPRSFMDAKKAAALLVDEVNRGNLTHYRQPELDLAARLAVKRQAGVNGWLFGRGKDWNLDITPLEAAALALLAYDEAQANKRPAPSITFT